MAVDVARGGHVLPGDSRVSHFHPVGKTTGRLRNDFKASRYGINRPRVVPKRLVIDARDKLGSEVDIELYVAASEGIDGVSCSRRFYVRLQRVAVHHVHTAVEQGGDRILQTGIIKNSDAGGGIEFEHDIGVASRPLIAPRPRTEQCGMSYAQLALHGFVFPQPGYDLFTVHIPTSSLTRPNNTRWSATNAMPARFRRPHARVCQQTHAGRDPGFTAGRPCAHSGHWAGS